MKIVHRMFQIMEQKGIMAVQLASHLGISKSVVSSWKSREKDPPSEYIAQICALLDISISYLITGETEIASFVPFAENKGTQDTKTISSDEERMLRWFRQLDECDQTILIGRAAKMVQLKKTEESEEDEETSPVFSAIRNHSKNRV